jgi:hypothetical protein
MPDCGDSKRHAPPTCICLQMLPKHLAGRLDDQAAAGMPELLVPTAIGRMFPAPKEVGE